MTRMALLACCSCSPAAWAQDSLILPPNPTPFSNPVQTDPLIDLVDRIGPPDQFRAEIESAVQTNALMDEARAGEREAQAARVQARSAIFPTLDLSVDAHRSFARNFSNDPGNIVERSRPAGRTDATASLRQRLLDFGAASSRINAGHARVEAARSGIMGYGTDVALRTLTAWYSILAQRLMERAAIDYGVRQMRLRAAVERRIEQGFSARGDLPRIDSSIASGQTRLARYQRDRASAEAQYRALAGQDAPIDLMRAPVPPRDARSRESRETLILRSPTGSITSCMRNCRRDGSTRSRSAS